MIGLGLVIFVHELGHFLAAKWAGIKVERFTVGLGKVFAFRRGETEYRIGAFPIGGYVHMLGQDDLRPQVTEEADPRSWQRATVGKRLVVLSSGVLMNVIFAAVAFVIVYLIGIRFGAPVVGGVKAGFPAATCLLPQEVAQAMGLEKAVSLRPGDRILALNGKAVRRFAQMGYAAMLSGEDDTFALTVARFVNGKELTFEVVLKPKRDKDVPGKPYIFGIYSAAVVTRPAEAHYAGQARFMKGDLIGEVAGNLEGFPSGLIPVIESVGQPVDVVAIRQGSRVPVRVETYLCSQGKEALEMLGMAARVEIGQAAPGSPAAKAGLRVGDIIVEYAGVQDPSQRQLAEANKQLYRKQTVIRVLRDGQPVQAKITPYRKGGRTDIGARWLPVQGETIVAQVAEDSPTAAAGVQPGAVITRVNDTPVKTWPEVYNALKAAAGEDVTLVYALAGAEHPAPIGPLTEKKFDPEKYFFDIPAISLGELEVVQTPPVRGSPVQALGWSVWDTQEFIATTYVSIVRILQRRIGTGGAAGPVGIGAAGIRIARKSAVDFVYFMAMLSIIIAVFNFLPLPVLDGGHAALVLIEKARGRPLPGRVQAAIQFAGLALIIGLFLALTYQDIMRFIK
ncbi:MAG: hypothetical protein AMJ81_01190 [Phycisphaerae bacterium SM23_33]|nr:MAG: hypothetical protein AMJ81_01190 [Phycisphaerae bacterium SM23_33]